MAIRKKGSRRIVVEDHEFRWRATGNDGWISLVIWPVANDQSRVIGNIGYHHKLIASSGQLHLTEQLVITNRLVRQVILAVGVPEILEARGQNDIGRLEDLIDISRAVRAKHLDTV